MLNLDSLKTRTLYSKAQIESLRAEFKRKLNDAYSSEAHEPISHVSSLLRMFYYLRNIPHFLHELNQLGEIQMMSLLEILFMKCSHWKERPDFQKWIGTLMLEIQPFTLNFPVKPQISAHQISLQQRSEDIQFFSEYLQCASRSNSIESMQVVISFLRVYLIDCLQNKKKELELTAADGHILPEWRSLNESLIRIVNCLDNIKLEEICISICYWLCSTKAEFIRECILKGIIGFLSQSLANKKISEWYGKKIIAFLKLLFLEGKLVGQNFSITEFQVCVARFTMKYDNEVIINQTRNLFAFLGRAESKIEQHQRSYRQYTGDKNSRNLGQAIEDLRILLLYAEEPHLKSELGQEENEEVMKKIINSEDCVWILNEIFNLIAYNYKHTGDKKESLCFSIIDKLSQILANPALKPEITSNKKKFLISSIRMLRQLLENKSKRSSVIARIKEKGIMKKLSKFSDCSNFRYERELFSLMNLLEKETNHDKESPSKNKSESAEVMKALVKHLDEGGRKVGRSLIEDELEEVELFYDMVARGEYSNIKNQTLKAITRKIKDSKAETEDVEIAILDSSDSERMREMANKINYYVTGSLEKLEKSPKTQGKFSLDKNDLQKVIHLGLTTEEAPILKTVTAYLAELHQHKRLTQEQSRDFLQIYRRYRDMFGEEAEIELEEEKKVSDVKVSVLYLLQQMGERELKQSQLQLLEELMLSEQDDEKVLEILQAMMKMENFSSLHTLLFLKFIYRISQTEKYKVKIFHNCGDELKSILQHQNFNEAEIKCLLYKILSEIFHPNFSDNSDYFQHTLNVSYSDYSKESMEFTDICLEAMSYEESSQRKEKVWTLIYNDHDLIGRETAHIIGGESRKQLEDKFWAYFKDPIEKRIEEEKRMALHFLEVYGKSVEADIWNKYELTRLLERLFQTLQNRSTEVFEKSPTQLLMKRLMRLSKGILSINENELIDISPFISAELDATTQILLTHPVVHSPKIGLLSEKYIENMMKVLRALLRRRESADSIIKIPIKIIDSIAEKVAEYKNTTINDIMIEIFRILMLRDESGEAFAELYKTLNDNKHRLALAMTKKGTEHFEACDRIAAYTLNKHPLKLKEQYFKYFFPQMDSKQIQRSLLSFSDTELLKHLKNLLAPPYQYGINILEEHLRLIESSDFCNTLVKVFLQSTKLYKQNYEDQTKSLAQIQQKITSCISGKDCEINSNFYQMINMNLVGLRVCLRTKRLGKEGIEIVCAKFFEYPEEIVLCAEILHLNIRSLKEWSVVEKMKIPAKVNEIYLKEGHRQEYGRSLANFIGSSSKSKQIQGEYKVQQELFRNLQIYSNDETTLGSTIYAISGLVYLHEKNQEALGDEEKIKQYLRILKQNEKSRLIFEKTCNLLSNLLFRNPKKIPICNKLGAEQTTIQAADNVDYQESTMKQFLRFIGNLSLTLDSASLIVRANFFNLWNRIMIEAEYYGHSGIIKYGFDILYNLLNFHEIEARSIAYKAYEAHCSVRVIQYLLKNHLNSDVVISGLDALQKLLILDVNRIQALENSIIPCLEGIAKTQVWNQAIFLKWVRILFALIKEPKTIDAVVKSDMLGRCAIFLKNSQQVKNEILILVVEIVDMLESKLDSQRLTEIGFLDIIVQLLKLREVKQSLALRIIGLVGKLHEEKVIQSGNYIKIFQGLIWRLQIDFRDQIATKIVSLLIKIREKVMINSKSATILLQFGCLFLTQKELITSHKYHQRVREFICLLSFFIAFNPDLKMLFKQEGFIEILESWIKIDKSLDEDNSVSEACRICIFVLQNDQRFLINIGEQLKDGAPVYSSLEKGRKCLLYRRNHTNKNAIVKLHPEKNPNIPRQLIAFKAPDGDVKQKYRAPLFEVIAFREFESSQDIIFKQSVFGVPGNIFQKEANPVQCVTVIAISGESLSVRQLDLEFVKASEKKEFVEKFKIAASLQFKERRANF